MTFSSQEFFHKLMFFSALGRLGCEGTHHQLLRAEGPNSRPCIDKFLSLDAKKPAFLANVPAIVPVEKLQRYD